MHQLSIQTPTLVIDELKVRRNIEFMSHKAEANGLKFRPHFKTHQSSDVGNWFRDYGVTDIAVSSLDMAKYFADQSWQNITVAFPYNPLEWEKVAELASKIHLNILIESHEALDHAKKHVKTELGYFIKLDVGYHRTGVNPSNIDLLQSLISSNGHFRFEGLLAHAGHSYNCQSKSEIIGVHQDVNKTLSLLKEELPDRPFISYGDTPTCSIMDHFSSVDELRCGNFAYYDLTQVKIGSCQMKDIAVAMACPVVATHTERNEILIFGGAVHFSKDHILYNDRAQFGNVVYFHEDGWEIVPNTFLKKISQEHGTIHGPADVISKIKFGDVIGVLPVHSCLASDLTRNQMTLKGEKIHKIRR